jgi:hypothetical protein
LSQKKVEEAMQLVDRKLGDKAWISGYGDGLTETTVVHVFEMYGRDHYVCEIPTHIDPILTVRDGLSVSDDPGQPIGLWRRKEHA